MAVVVFGLTLFHQERSVSETQPGTTLQILDERDLRENCRLLSIVSGTPPDLEAYETILKGFCRPSYPQDNGWSLAAYSDIRQGGRLSVPNEPMIIRTQVSINQDLQMWGHATELMLRLEPTVIMGHLRNASSGCALIADPHPFVRRYKDKTYLMIHNGGVWGKDLDYLVDYLIDTDDLPASCPGNPIDSEYLFIYLMQLIKEYDGDVWPALTVWANTLIQTFVDDWNAMNILLTDGHLTWAARISYKSNRFSLTYQKLPKKNGYAISTQALGTDWTPIPNFSIAEFHAGHPVYIETLPRPIVYEFENPYPVAMPDELNHTKP